ncbi:right-handed parallel beta-helix repeat-containing protein, partial [Wenzhouxiangella marina]
SPFTYRLTGEVAVPAGATLTLPPGTVVKADVGGRSLTVLGLLEAVGTSAEPVVFTEIRDDTVGGDSGFPGDPAPGAWNGIDIRDGGSAVLEQARIRYTGQSTFLTWAIRKFGSGDLVLLDTYIAFGSRDGVVIDGAGGSLLLQGNRIEGMGGNGMIIRNAAASIQILSNRILDNLGNGVLIEEASPLIQNSRLARNAQAGVRVSGASSAPTLTANWISGNNVGVDSYSGANPLIGGSEGSGNDLVDNTLFGVRNNDSGLVIDARFNWWGHPSGPQDPIGNPTGLGDAVSEWVDYSDFLDRSAVDGLFSDRFLSQP